MKKTIYSVLIAIICALVNPFGVYSQEMMYITKTDKSVLTIPISEIEKITYKNSVSPSTGNTVTDIDGNVYNTVKIGTQTWMQSDLKVTRFNDGTPIANVIVNEQWFKTTAAAYCWYNNEKPNSNNPYGAMYNGFAARMSSLCPKGWHVPSMSELEELVKYCGRMGADSPKKLKEAGRSHWVENPESVTNETGFTALPTGWRKNWGDFEQRGNNGFWWTNTGSGLYQGSMRIHENNVPTYFAPKTTIQFGGCVRCLMD
ncbi:MAG: FISUMP domain-containing protein [Bacteroidota bacterium]|nr:FISUMP domain-containing protein [Bacteroidota bacterium]